MIASPDGLRPRLPQRTAAALRIAATLAAASATASIGCGDSVPEFPQDAGPMPECEVTIEIESPDAGPGPSDGGDSRDAGGASDGGDSRDAGGASDAGGDAAAGTGGRGGPAGGGDDGGGVMMDAGGGSEMDAGSSGMPGCSDSEVCLPPGRCYDKCDPTTDQPCAANEMCSEMGACVPRTEPRRDSGPQDAPPSDACDDAECPAACRVIAGEATCVECNSREDCPSGAAPICDVARGVCVAFADEPCAPCNNDADCPTTGTCETRDAFGGEQVCLPTPAADGGTCPTGLKEDPGSPGQCVPDIGSCTGWRAAVTGRSCSGDADCVPLGADVASGTCAIPTTDGGTPDGGATGVCLQPCQPTTLICPPGTTCNTVTEFCRSS